MQAALLGGVVEALGVVGVEEEAQGQVNSSGNSRTSEHCLASNREKTIK